VSQSTTRVETFESRTRLLDPRQLMKRGWSVTRRTDGTVVRSIADVSPTDVLATQLADGSVTSTVNALSADEVQK
jgi:exodeoxyribonuclease VII large subunit